MTNVIYGDLPPLTLSIEELKKVIISLLAAYPGSYSFISYINSLSEHFIKSGNGFKASPNTIYSGCLCQVDQAKVREIIWDMIIDRYLNVGGNGHHEWPNFSVTERGKFFFEEIKKIPDSI